MKRKTKKKPKAKIKKKPGRKPKKKTSVRIPLSPEAVYFMRTALKKSFHQIGRELKVSHTCAINQFKAFRDELTKTLPDQEINDIVSFYEAEMKELIERREKLKGRFKDSQYLKYTKLIAEIQDKIVEVLGMVTRNMVIEEHKHLNLIKIDIKELEHKEPIDLVNLFMGVDTLENGTENAQTALISG